MLCEKIEGGTKIPSRVERGTIKHPTRSRTRSRTRKPRSIRNTIDGANPALQPPHRNSLSGALQSRGNDEFPSEFASDNAGRFVPDPHHAKSLLRRNPRRFQHAAIPPLPADQPGPSRFPRFPRLKGRPPADSSTSLVRPAALDSVQIPEESVFGVARRE